MRSIVGFIGTGIISCLFLSFLTASVFGIAAPDPGGEVYLDTGTLHIDGSPVGMEVALDGRASGQVPESGVLIIDNIAVGGHTLTASYPEYETQEMAVEVPDGLPAEIRVNLEKDSGGSLDISSTPTNVQIYVDDLYKGITPAVVIVSSGSHVVQLRLSGYQDWSMQTEVTGGQVTLVSGTLTPVSGSPVSTPSSGPGMFGVLVLAGIGCLVACRFRR